MPRTGTQLVTMSRYVSGDAWEGKVASSKPSIWCGPPSDGKVEVAFVDEAHVAKNLASHISTALF